MRITVGQLRSLVSEIVGMGGNSISPITPRERVGQRVAVDIDKPELEEADKPDEFQLRSRKPTASGPSNDEFSRVWSEIESDVGNMFSHMSDRIINHQPPQIPPSRVDEFETLVDTVREKFERAVRVAKSAYAHSTRPPHVQFAGAHTYTKSWHSMKREVIDLLSSYADAVATGKYGQHDVKRFETCIDYVERSIVNAFDAAVDAWARGNP